jgi:hypothetical protein
VFVAPGHADVSVEGYVERTADGFRAQVSITDQHGDIVGKRTLQSADPTCRDLDASLALTLSLLIDPNAALSPSGAPSTEPDDEVGEPDAEADVAFASDRFASSADDGRRASTELGGGLAVGLLPGVALGLVLRGSVTPPRTIRIVFDGAVWMDREKTPEGGGDPVGFSLLEAGLGACPLGADHRAIRMRLCGGAAVGALSTRGLVDGRIRVERHVAAGAFLRGELDLVLAPHLFVELGLGLRAPFVRDWFDYELDGDRRELFRMSPVAAIVDLGLGFESP